MARNVLPGSVGIRDLTVGEGEDGVDTGVKLGKAFQKGLLVRELCVGDGAGRTRGAQEVDAAAGAGDLLDLLKRQRQSP